MYKNLNKLFQELEISIFHRKILSLSLTWKIESIETETAAIYTSSSLPEVILLCILMTGEQNVQGLFQGCIPTKPAKYVQLVSFLSKIIVLRLYGTLGYVVWVDWMISWKINNFQTWPRFFVIMYLW